MNLKRILGTATAKTKKRVAVVRVVPSKRSRLNKAAARIVLGKAKKATVLISSPLGPIVKPRDREQNRVHYDMMAANEYCKQQGKVLKDLTPDELQQFQVGAKILKPTRRF
jgi:putative hemolysin